MGKTGAIIIGAGQAGLAVSHELARHGLEHVILERGRIGQAWRDRWDAFCLVTPNWSVRLPGFPYDGDDPDGFMPRDEIVAHLERYAASFGAPVREGVTVTRVTGGNGRGFRAETSHGTWTAPRLVVTTGAYQKALTPRGAETLPPDLPTFLTGDYANPGTLPPGDVLIVGSGQTGCQLAEELTEAGRRVVLACGRAPWCHRRYGDHDVVWWLEHSGFMDVPAADLPEEARLFANVLTTGHDGGRDMTFRTLHARGIELAGRFLGAEDGTARFADDLGDSIAWGDARAAGLADVFRDAAGRLGKAPLDIPDPAPFAPAAPTEIPLDAFGAVLFTGGFRPDYTSWLPWPGAFDAGGFPIQSDGASTVIPGLCFAGVHFMRNRKSAILLGVGEDAEIVSRAVLSDIA